MPYIPDGIENSQTRMPGGVKIYLAGSSKDTAWLPFVQEQLRKLQVWFTCPWWDNIKTGSVAETFNEGKMDARLDLELLQFNAQCAEGDLKGIVEADMAVFAFDPLFPTPGAMFELAAAILWQEKPVLIISHAAPAEFRGWIFPHWCMLERPNLVHWSWGDHSGSAIMNVVSKRYAAAGLTK